jgi:hypothetical protein
VLLTVALWMRMPAPVPDARMLAELTRSLSMKRTPPPVASTLPALIPGDPEMTSADPLLALTVPPLLTVSWPVIVPTPTIVPPLDTVAFRLVPLARIRSVIPLPTAKLLSV